MVFKVKRYSPKKIICSLFLTVQLFELRAMKAPEDRHQREQRELAIPQSLSPIKYQTISLSKTSENLFPLKLNQTDQSIFIDYQWDGKSVVQYIASNKKMLLKSSDPYGYNFSITDPVQTGDLNINLPGRIIFQEAVNAGGTALIACRSLQNKKDFNSDKLLFSGEELSNEGSINTNNCDIEKCLMLLNKKNWTVSNDCHLKQLDNFTTSENSAWSVGGTWAVISKNLHLRGNSSAENAALFSIESTAIFDGHFNTPILHAESNGTLDATSQAKFFIDHHLGLKAKELLSCQSDILEKPTDLNKSNPSADPAMAYKLFQKGVFLQSENSNLYKSGIIQVKDKPVYMIAKNELKHDHLTQSGEDQSAAIMLAGEYITLEKESVLKSCTAQLDAQELIMQQGIIQISSFKSDHDVAANTVDTSGLLTLNAKKIVTSEASQINAKTICMKANEKIDQQGMTKAEENFLQVAPVIEARINSSIMATNAFINGTEKLSQKGNLHANNLLLLRSNQLFNQGTIEAENSHLKADRWWLNTGSINIHNELNIDALVSVNMLFGWIQAKILRINALYDVNFLGFYKTQDANINAISGFNAGVYLPQVNSWCDLFNMQSFKSAIERVFLLTSPISTQTYYQARKFLHDLPSLCRTIYGLYSLWMQLPKTYSGASDIVPLLAQSVNVGLSTLQQIKIRKDAPDASLTSLKAIRSIAQAFGPNQNRKTLIDLNCGIMAGFNAQSLNVWNLNAGAALFANSYKLDTCYGTDIGALCATDLNIYATHSYKANSTAYLGCAQAVIEADTLDVNGKLNAIDQATLKAEKLADIAATISTGNRINVIAPTVNLQKQCHLDSKSGTVSIIADRISDAATIDGQLIHTKAKDIILKDGSYINPCGTHVLAVIETENFTAENGARLTAPAVINQESDNLHNRIIILTTQADLQKGSSFDAAHGAMNIAAEKLTTAATIDGQLIQIQASDTALKEGSIIRPKGNNPLVTIQAQNFKAESGTQIIVNNTSEQESTDAIRIMLQAPNIDLQEGSSFDSGKGTTAIVAEQTDIAAAMKGKLQIQTANVVFKEDSTFDMSDLIVNAIEKITQKAKLNTAVLVMRAKSVENSGDITTQDGEIKADRYYWNTGNATSKNTLHIDTPLSVNWHSRTQAKHLTTNALIDIDLLSCDRTQNSTRNSLIGLDLSLHLPLEYQGLVSMTRQGLRNAGERAFLLVAPPPIRMGYTLAKAACNIPGMWKEGSALCKEIKALYYNPNARESDWVPLITRTSNLALTLAKTGKAAQELASQSEVTLTSSLTHLKELKDTLTLDTLKNSLTINNLKSSFIAAQSTTGELLTQSVAQLKDLKNNTPLQNLRIAALIVEPLVNQNSTRNGLIDFSPGLAIGFNGSSMNIRNFHTIKLFANYELDTYLNTNLGGGIIAANQSFNVKHWQNGISLNIGGYKFELPAYSIGLGTLKVDSFENNGTILNADNIKAESVTNNGTILNVANVEAKSIKNNGPIKNVGNLQAGILDNKGGGILQNIGNVKADILKNENAIRHVNSIKSDSINNESDINDVVSISANSICNKGTIEKVDNLEAVLIDNKNTLQNIANLKTNTFKGSANSKIIASPGGFNFETQEIDDKGTTEGGMRLKFTGKPEQFKQLGTVDSQQDIFGYEGPLATTSAATSNLPTADELVRGSWKGGNIINPVAIVCDSGSQDIHSKDQHTIAHTFIAKTEKAITTDKPIKSEKTLDLYAGTHLYHNSLMAGEHIRRVAKTGNITAAVPMIKQVQNGNGFEEVIEQIKVSAGKSNTAYAKKDIIQTAAGISAGKEGAYLKAGGNIIDNALNTQKYTEHPTPGNPLREETPHVSCYKSEGGLVLDAGGHYKGQAPQFDVKGKPIIIEGGKSVIIKDVHKGELRPVNTEEKSWRVHNKTQGAVYSSQSEGASFNGHGTSALIKAPEVTLQNISADVPPTLECDTAQILLGENRTSSVLEKGSYGWIVNDEGERTKKEDVTYTPHQLPGIENHTKEFMIQSIKGKTDKFLKKIHTVGDGTVSQTFIKEMHRSETIPASRELTKGARAVLGLGIIFLTQGMAPGIAAGLTSLGVNGGASIVLSNISAGTLGTLLNTATNTLVETRGDILKAAELMASSQTLKDVTFAALSSGIGAGADQALTTLGMPVVHDAFSFPQKIAYAAPRELIHAGIQTGLGVLAAGQPPEQALQQQGREFLAKTLHTALVSQIADLYANDSINSLTHKTLHAAAGATYGGIIAGKSGVLAGGLGALAAEVTAELLAPSKRIMDTIVQFEVEQGHSLSQQEFMSHYASALQNYMHKTLAAQQIAQLTAAVTALAAGQEVDVAHHAALTALNNNFLVLALYGITAASTAYSGYKIYKSFEEDGAIGALKQLGIEVAYNAAGHAIGRAGGMVYPSVRAATIAVLDEAPALKLILGNVADKLVMAAEQINQTAIGQAVNKVEAALMKQEAKILRKLGLGSGAVGTSELLESTERASFPAEQAEEVVLAGTDIKIKAPKASPIPQTPTMALSKAKEIGKQRSIPKVMGAPQAGIREQILSRMQTYEHARNKALEILGELDFQSGKPYIGKFDIFKGKVVGRSWHDGEVVMRLDWDAIKGPHINVTDFRLGKGAKGVTVAIPFEGTLETAANILNHLN